MFNFVYLCQTKFETLFRTDFRVIYIKLSSLDCSEKITFLDKFYAKLRSKPRTKNTHL